MKVNIIDLANYKNFHSSIYTGRPQGEEVRKLLKLDDIDKNDCEVVFEIPDNTISFNPSFYLGLLFDSYKFLTPEGFLNKYSFKINSGNAEILKVIQKDLLDGQRNAINSLKEPTSILGSFFNFKKK